MCRLGRGRVLRTQVESDAYDSSYYDPRGVHEFTFPVPNVPYLKIAAVAEEAGSLSLFMLNRDLTQEMEVSLEARSFGRLAVSEELEVRHDDLQATNTRDAPGAREARAVAGRHHQWDADASDAEAGVMECGPSVGELKADHSRSIRSACGFGRCACASRAWSESVARIRRQRELKDGAAGLVGARPQASVVGLDN
jgi:hypothetical protein